MPGPPSKVRIYADYAYADYAYEGKVRFNGDEGAAELQAAFGEEDVRRRQFAFKQIAKDPLMMNIFAGAFLGPENVPAEFFIEAFYEKTFGTLEHMVA